MSDRKLFRAVLCVLLWAFVADPVRADVSFEYAVVDDAAVGHRAVADVDGYGDRLSCLYAGPPDTRYYRVCAELGGTD